MGVSWAYRPSVCSFAAGVRSTPSPSVVSPVFYNEGGNCDLCVTARILVRPAWLKVEGWGRGGRGRGRGRAEGEGREEGREKGKREEEEKGKGRGIGEFRGEVGE